MKIIQHIITVLLLGSIVVTINIESRSICKMDIANQNRTRFLIAIETTTVSKQELSCKEELFCVEKEEIQEPEESFKVHII